MAVQIKLDAGGCVEDKKRFFCQDGRVCVNLVELVDCLSNMTEDVFHHHVTFKNNDFSNWVRDVLGNEELASKIANVNNPLEASKIVTDSIMVAPQEKSNRKPSSIERAKRVRGISDKKRGQFACLARLF